jgi:hypothetical protein
MRAPLGVDVAILVSEPYGQKSSTDIQQLQRESTITRIKHFHALTDQATKVGAEPQAGTYYEAVPAAREQDARTG